MERGREDQYEERALENGVIRSRRWQCDEILLGHSMMKVQDFGKRASSSRGEVVRFHFGMKGNYSFTSPQLGQTFDLIGGHHNILYAREFDMVVENRTLDLETFGIQFPVEVFLALTQDATDQLKRFGEKLVQGESALVSPYWGAIELPIQQVLQQIIHCRYDGSLKRMFLLSKTMELLVLCADAYDRIGKRTSSCLKGPGDYEKIVAARDMVLDRLQSPPDLSEIARTVGLNEFKLKRGFREVFNHTVFGYLTEQRLQLAYRTLQDTPHSVATIATDLGYATPQHFNNAFKKKFGITPFLVRKNPA